MGLEKYAKRLKREIRANPTKAAVLAVLVVVCIVYCAPLVKSWIAKPMASKPAAKSVVATPAAAAPATETAHSSLTWKQIARALEQEPLAQPAPPRLGRDPFGVQARLEALESAAAKVAAKKTDNQPKVDVTPQSLGITLSSTIIGGKRSVARIAGKSYEVGQTIEVDAAGETYAYTLAEILPRTVILTRDGVRYDVRLPKHSSTPSTARAQSR